MLRYNLGYNLKHHPKFIVAMIVILFIFVTLHQYRKRIFVEDFIIEYLNVNENVNEGQNIANEPDEPVEQKPLDLTSNTPSSIKEYVNRTVINAISSVRPDTQGPPGVMGPKGEQGESGGTFLNQGFLRSIRSPNLFLDRDTNKLTVNTKTYDPKQIWIHSSDGKMMNQYNKNECLSANEKGELEIAECPVAEKWNYVGKFSQLRTMKPVDGNMMCLELKNTPENGKDEQYSVILNQCANGASVPQAWTFH